MKGDFVATLSNVYWIDPEPTWASQFNCTQPNAYTGWCDQQFDALMADQRQSIDANQRITDIKAAQKIFVTQVPTLFWQQRAAWVFTQPKLQNIQLVNDGLALWDRVWIKSH
jgi:ABC-type transport system substrate-binding protein